MRIYLSFLLAFAAQFSLATLSASAHPGSGIVVDEEGNVYFTHTGRGCGKIDPEGKLTYVHDSKGGHWLSLDVKGSFSRTQPIELKDCDVDYPDNNPNFPLPSLRGLAVDEHGAVFAACVGCHAVVKIMPDGKVETILKAERPWSPTGVAVHRGEVYILEYTNANGSLKEGWRPRVRKLGRDGKVTTLVTVAPEPSRPQQR